MIEETDILNLGFEKQSYSTDTAQYYTLVVSRAKDYKQYNVRNEYTFIVNSEDPNLHTLRSELVLSSFRTITNCLNRPFIDAEDLESEFKRLVKWDLTRPNNR